MRVYRTFDENFIYDCTRFVWDAVSDDGELNPELYFPNMSEDNYWMMAEEDDGKKLGVFLYAPQNHICREVHTILLPIAKGRAKEAAIASGLWIFDNTNCMRIVTTVPEYNIPAFKLALEVGMKQYGINRKSFLKNGVLYDQHLLGISKGDKSCQ